MTPHLYAKGEHVAVFDRKRGRWVRGSIKMATIGRALVATARWWGFVPAQDMRPVHLVNAA